MNLIERYADKITGVLSCYDRLIIQGTVPGWCFAAGMTTFLQAHQIRIFDFPQWANDLREELRQSAEQLASDHGLKIEFIRKIKAFRKEQRIKEILDERGLAPGLVHIFSAMETCNRYQPWHDKPSGTTALKPSQGKCLHYYFYFIDPQYGLCYLRVPTWAPFRLQFYCNGHNRLQVKLEQQQIGHRLRENAFVHLADGAAAQELSDHFRIEDLHQALDIFARRYCPVVARYDLVYHWSIMQAEYATDIIFANRQDLQYVYGPLIRTAVHSVKPENIATFLGQKLHPLYQGEMGNHLNTRILGTRIKHQMKDAALKMYDKFGLVLRIETTVNDVSQFKVYREVRHRDGSTVKKYAPMQKSIYSLTALQTVLKAANRRYLEFISALDDPSEGIRKLEQVTRPVTVKDRPYPGFNFFAAPDVNLFEFLARGELLIAGFYHKTLQRFFPEQSRYKLSRTLKHLRVHGLIKKVGKTYKYYVTRLGKAIISAGLSIREMTLIPLLAQC
jgi:hypothetical protein